MKKTFYISKTEIKTMLIKGDKYRVLLIERTGKNKYVGYILRDPATVLHLADINPILSQNPGTGSIHLNSVTVRLSRSIYKQMDKLNFILEE